MKKWKKQNKLKLIFTPTTNIKKFSLHFKKDSTCKITILEKITHLTFFFHSFTNITQKCSRLTQFFFNIYFVDFNYFYFLELKLPILLHILQQIFFFFFFLVVVYLSLFSHSLSSACCRSPFHSLSSRHQVAGGMQISSEVGLGRQRDILLSPLPP